MYERFTDRARSVLWQANLIAYYYNHEYIATEHLLLALFEEGDTVAANALRNLFLDPSRLYQEVEMIVQRGPYSCSRYKRPRTPRVKQVIADAIEEAELLDANYVGTEHLLLALVRQTEGVAAQILMNLGLKREEIRGEVLRILGCEIPVEKSSNVPPRPGAVPPSAESDRQIAMEKSAMYERFTDRARKVMQLANQEAQRFNHEYIGTEHILLGLVKEGSGVAANVLKNLDIDLRKIRLEVEKIVQSGPDMVTMGRLPQTPWAKKVIEYAIEEARSLKHNYVGTEHLLLGLTRAQDSVAGQILMNLGLNLHDLRGEALDILGYPKPAKKSDGEVVARVAPLSAAEEAIRFLEQKIQNDRERIRSLEKQLWSLRVLLGAVVGAIASALIWTDKGMAAEGLILGGIIAGLGGRIFCALASGITGTVLGCVQLGGQGGGISGALLGALVGFLIAEIGGSSKRR